MAGRNRETPQWPKHHRLPWFGCACTDICVCLDRHTLSRPMQVSGLGNWASSMLFVIHGHGQCANSLHLLPICTTVSSVTPMSVGVGLNT